MENFIIAVISTLTASLINFIATLIYNGVTGSSKNFLWKNKVINLETIKVTTDFEELKRRSKIVIIDDENGFPIKLFKDENYNIEKWDKVKDYGRLENGNFDIIILDIKGVAQHISEEDGLGVLVNLKKKNPAQIIISYSQHSYDLNKIQFFQQADENITKPSDFLKIKAILDNLIMTQFKPERYINALKYLLQSSNVDEKEITKIYLKLAKTINSNIVPDWNNIFSAISDRNELKQQSIGLGKTIVKFYH